MWCFLNCCQYCGEEILRRNLYYFIYDLVRHHTVFSCIAKETKEKLELICDEISSYVVYVQWHDCLPNKSMIVSHRIITATIGVNIKTSIHSFHCKMCAATKSNWFVDRRPRLSTRIKVQSCIHKSISRHFLRAISVSNCNLGIPLRLHESFLL